MISIRFFVFLLLLIKCINVNAMYHGVNILSLTDSSSSSDGDVQWYAEDVSTNDHSLWKIISRESPYHLISRAESVEMVEKFSNEHGAISIKGQQKALKQARALSDQVMCELIKNLDVDRLIIIKLPAKKQASRRVVSGEHEQKWTEQREKMTNDSSL